MSLSGSFNRRRREPTVSCSRSRRRAPGAPAPGATGGRGVKVGGWTASRSLPSRLAAPDPGTPPPESGAAEWDVCAGSRGPAPRVTKGPLNPLRLVATVTTPKWLKVVRKDLHRSHSPGTTLAPRPGPPHREGQNANSRNQFGTSELQGKE